MKPMTSTSAVRAAAATSRMAEYHVASTNGGKCPSRWPRNNSGIATFTRDDRIRSSVPEPTRGSPMGSTISRRSALKLLATSGSAVIVAACSGQIAPSASAPTAAAVASGGATAGPKPGGMLRIGLAAEPANIDGHIRTPGSDLTYWLAFDRLIDYDERAQPQPGLAESWDVAPDFKSVTFHLRKGVTFHSGREFTSDDVKWNFLRVRDPKLGGSTLGAYSQWWATIGTPDKYTVTLQSELSRPTLFDSLQLFNMLDKESMEGPNAKSEA